MYIALWNNLNIDQLHVLDMGMIQFLVDFHIEDVAYTEYFYILGELGPYFPQNQNHIFQGEKMRKFA